MDKLLLNALNNLSVALEMLTESLAKKDPKSNVGKALHSGDFGKQIEQIQSGIKSIKEDTSKILDNTETIIKLQKEKRDKDIDLLRGAGKDSNKKMIKDGVSVVVLIAGAVLAIGMAFKLIGDVNWASVLSISLALPLMAYSFERVGQIKDISPSKIAFVGLSLVAMATAITISSWILSKVSEVGLFQLTTVVFIAGAFSAAAYGIGHLLRSFKDISVGEALAASVILPIVLLSVSVAIATSSYILKNVQSVGLYQALTVVFIAAAFGAISYGIGKLISGFKGISASEAIAAAVLMPVVLVGLSYAIALSSRILQGVQPIGLFQALGAILIAGAFVVLSYAVKPLLQGVKDVKAEDMIKGGIILVGLTAAVVAASILMQGFVPVGLFNILSFTFASIGIAVSTVALALAIKVVNTLGSVGDYIKGGISIIVIAGTIALASQIFNLGNYNSYPSISWALGTGLSLAAFGIGAVLLGTQALNPFFYAGLGVTLLVAGTVVAASLIMGLGTYEKYPPLSWVAPTMLVLGGFGIMSVLLGSAFPFITIGSIAALMIAGSIFAIDQIFSNGQFRNYPSDRWVNQSMSLLGKYSILSMMLAFASPLIALGTISIMMIVGSILLIDKIFSSGSFDSYPSESWMKGSTGTINKFAFVIKNIRNTVGFGDLILGAIKLLSLVEIIKNIDETLSSGKFRIYPSKEWINGVSYSIQEFTKLMGESSFFAIIGEKIKSFFGGGIDDLAVSLVNLDSIFSRGNFTKYPNKDFIDGVIYSLQKFKDLQSLMSDSDSKVGVKLDSSAISNITTMATAFDRLGQAVEKFSDSINNIDMQKIDMVRGLTSNVVMLSLMDPNMFNEMMNKLEKRGGVFSDLIRDFEDKKEVSKSSSSVRQVSPSSNVKSDSQLLGEKVDRMTAILADISTVVGSGGTLKSYLNSIKEKQLMGSSNSPSVNRSDKRLKNILGKIGQSLSGINIYSFTYLFNTKVVYQGVIAQELLGTSNESAVVIDKNGFYSVDYSKIDVDFKKITT